MRISSCLMVACVVAILPAKSAAQRPAPLSPLGPAPLLYVQFSAPAGVRLTFYQGQAPTRDFPAPVIVGLRPGYIYRMKVTGFPARPNFAVYPTLEVRGTLRLTPELSALKFPAPIFFSPDDVERLIGGSLLTKVLYLEDPRQAIAEASARNRPIEIELPGDRDLLDESRAFGRPVLVLRLGNRDVDEDELRRQAVPNTILFPGDKGIGIPRGAPHLPWVCFNPFDPILGPKAPEECLRDGGDAGEPVGFDATGRLGGLEPEDTAAQYRDSQGRRRVSVSNRVCLCVPRYVALRNETRLEQARIAVVLGAVRRSDAQIQLESETIPKTSLQLEHVAGAMSQTRPSVAQANQWATAIGKVEGLQVVQTQARTSDVTAMVREAPQTPDRPLALKKWPDREAAEVGDVITFFLKYTNLGGQPITDVVVSDSLTGRLEYVAGSAQTSRNAVFTTEGNEGGSAILRWQVAGRLLPGESGILSFRARVR